MALTTDYPHVEKCEGQPARLQRIPRVRVAQIAMDYLAHGWSTDEMCRQHPYLMPAEAHAAMAYYFDHQSEIDEEIRAELAQVEQAQRAAPRSPFVAKLRARGIVSNEEFAKRMMLLARPARQFEPTATYDPDGDCIEFLAKPDPFYAERIDDLVTVYYSQETGELIGSLIKGVSEFCVEVAKKMPGFKIEIHDSQ